MQNLLFIRHIVYLLPAYMHIHTRTPAYTYIRAQRYINIREFLSHGLVNNNDTVLACRAHYRGR